MDQTRQLIDVGPRCTLMLAHIGESRNNDLRVVLIEATPAATPVQSIVGLVFPVRPDATSRAFELTWYCYVAYAVINESYSRGEEPGAVPAQRIWAGPIGVRSESAFLKYISSTTLAGSGYPGPLTHWYIDTQWHCIDVISVDAPEVRQLSAEECATVCRQFN